MGWLPPISGHQVMAISLALLCLLPALPADLTMGALSHRRCCAYDWQHSPSFVRVERVLPQSSAPPKTISLKSGPKLSKPPNLHEEDLQEYQTTHLHSPKMSPLGIPGIARNVDMEKIELLGVESLLMWVGTMECCWLWALHSPGQGNHWCQTHWQG